MSRVCAALIVRNEEAHLGPCLDSVHTLVDEIIVVDTGSTDRTRDVARDHGAVLVEEPWRDDFAHARNTALSVATGDWILYIDADERLEVQDDLHPWLDDPEVVAARVRFRASSKLTSYREHRLFRNRPDIRFRSVIHETVAPDVLALVDRGAGRVVDAPLHIEHLGYEGDLSHKHERNLPLLRRAVAEWPERLYLHMTLGEAQFGLGDAEAAEQSWRAGLAQVRSRPPQPGDVLLYADLLDLHFAPSGTTLDDADALAGEMARRHADDPLTLWWTGRRDVECDRFDDARGKMRRLLEMGRSESSVAELGYDLGLFDVFPSSLLGTCCLREGDADAALEWFRRAESGSHDPRGGIDAAKGTGC